MRHLAIPLTIFALAVPAAGASAAAPQGGGLQSFDVECNGVISAALHAGNGASAWVDGVHVIHVEAVFPGGSFSWGKKTGFNGGTVYVCHPDEGVTITAVSVPGS